VRKHKNTRRGGDENVRLDFDPKPLGCSTFADFARRHEGGQPWQRSFHRRQVFKGIYFFGHPKTAVKAISSTSKSGETGESQQAGALPPKKNWWHKERRDPITISELELAISEDIKNAAPGCEDFVGVIVRHETPKTHLDPNWAILGVKFGKADRKMANEALATVVERMQRVFLLSDAKRRPP
jgi:hypothetical protein